MNKIITLLCLVQHWFEVWQGKNKRKANRTALSVIAKMLFNSISRCETHMQLLACEKAFQDYVYEYRDDQSIETFKQSVLSQMQHQRVSIQIQESKLKKPII